MGDCPQDVVPGRCKCRNVHIRRRSVPLAEIYSSISETLPAASVGKTEILRAEAAPVVGGVGEAEFAVLPTPQLERVAGFRVFGS